VLILNGGSIGLYGCDIAGALGASRRLFVDRDRERRALAEAYGAETAESTDAIPQGFDVAVEATGRVDALACACRSLVPEGICESAGNHFQPGELPLFEMYLSSINLRIARDNVRAHIPAALDLAQGGRVEPRKVVSHVLDWETLPDELPKLHRKPVFVRQPVQAAA
jgi:threonine dehydrogenase-like Zn-dependent dehydrogenase